jgi:ubiquitin carboxyl-terminal hydrolase 48
MIYNWRPEEDPDENKFHSQSILSSVAFQSNPNSDYHPIGSIGKLQLIFGLMQFGVRPSVDPTPIIECLQLNSSEQQDAHEFSNLFITHIEKRLQFQRDESIRKTIENQYCGKCVYITRSYILFFTIFSIELI